MISIQIPTVLRRFTGNQEFVVVEAGTVREAIEKLVAGHPALRKHLFDDSGKLRSFVNVYLAEHDVRHLAQGTETPLVSGDRLTLVPSIAGGSDSDTQESTAGFLTSAEIRRYSRHLMLPEVGMEGQRRLKSASVLVVGAGGLGSPLLAYLAAAGVGRVGIVDQDLVDETNLQRQIIHGTKTVGMTKLESARVYLENLNPHVHVELWNTFLSSENALDIARDYDILVDGTDNFPTRYLVNDVAFLLGKPNVYGSIFRFEGQASVFCANGGPCYRCLYPEPPPPGLVPSCAEGGVLGVLPGIVGSIQATETVKTILGVGNTLAGRLLRFDALRMEFREFVLRRDPDCPLCGEHPSISTLVDYYEFCGLPASPDAHLLPDEMNIEASELHSRLVAGNGQRPFLLDVRNEEEVAIATLPGSHLIPLAELDFRLHEIARDREIVVYCRSGVRSARAVLLLRDAGFERVRNLDGGILAWADEVDPTVNRY